MESQSWMIFLGHILKAHRATCAPYAHVARKCSKMLEGSRTPTMSHTFPSPFLSPDWSKVTSTPRFRALIGSRWCHSKWNGAKPSGAGRCDELTEGGEGFLGIRAWTWDLGSKAEKKLTRENGKLSPKNLTLALRGAINSTAFPLYCYEAMYCFFECRNKAYDCV